MTACLQPELQGPRFSDSTQAFGPLNMNELAMEWVLTAVIMSALKRCHYCSYCADATSVHSDQTSEPIIDPPRDSLFTSCWQSPTHKTLSTLCPLKIKIFWTVSSGTEVGAVSA